MITGWQATLCAAKAVTGTSQAVAPVNYGLGRSVDRGFREWWTVAGVRTLMYMNATTLRVLWSIDDIDTSSDPERWGTLMDCLFQSPVSLKHGRMTTIPAGQGLQACWRDPGHSSQIAAEKLPKTHSSENQDQISPSTNLNRENGVIAAICVYLSEFTRYSTWIRASFIDTLQTFYSPSPHAYT